MYNYDRRMAAMDPKAFLTKILGGAEKELRTFISSLPAQAQAWERISIKMESLPPRGGYGPYEVGYLWFNAGLKGGKPIDVALTAHVVVDLSDGTVSIGAMSGNHVLESLASRGTMQNAPARMQKVLSFFKERLEEAARRVPTETKPGPAVSDGAWSVVSLGKSHGYATEVQVFSSKEKAEQEAMDQGNCYVVKGTQMWNEPLGQVEEHDRPAPSKFFP
jgi:hypothetical protein